MKAVIMAGGFGTRLRPLTSNIPKPMVPIMNRPIMEHIIRLLHFHQMTDLIVTLFHQPDHIINYFGDGSRFGVHLRYLRADADYGTAGSVRNAAEFLDDRFLVISGDVLTDFNLTKAVEFHLEQQAKVTLVLHHSPNPLQYGVVITRDDGRIIRFVEKPTWGEVFSDTINTGIYIIEPEILEVVPREQEFDFSKNLFPLLLERDEPLFGYISEGYWRDIGNLTEYQEAHWDALAGRVRVELSGTKVGNTSVGQGTKLPEGAKDWKEPVVIGENCTIEDDVVLSKSVIGNEVRIERGAVIEDSVVWNNVTIGRGARLTADVVATGTSIGEEAVISENVFIGEKCLIGSRAHLAGNIKLWPAKIVEEGAVLTKSLVWENRWTRELFADARITGYSNVEMNPELGARLGAAFGAFVGSGKTVATSRDVDNVSRMMNRAIICGLISAGVNVNDLRATPIPILRHELRSRKEFGGVHVRKSPYDRTLTDVIFFDAGGKDLPVSKTKTIERLFFGEEVPRVPAEKVGSIHFPERTSESYLQKFLSNLNVEVIRNRKFKLVIDYSHGITATIFPTILGSLGCDIVALNAYLDASKLTRERQEIEKAQQQLSHIVKSLGEDIGFMIDPGGEKLFVVDEEGNSITSDRLLVIVTKLFLEAKPNVKKIAVPIAASMEVDLVAKEHKVEVLKTKGSHLAMMNAATEPGVSFVGGTKGGFIFPEFSFAADAMFAVAKILELLAETGEKLGAVDQTLPKFRIVQRDIPCPWESKGKVMRLLTKESENMKREEVEGIRFYPGIGDPPSSVFVVPDKERALFHLRVESTDELLARNLADEYEDKIMKWRDHKR